MDLAFPFCAQRDAYVGAEPAAQCVFDTAHFGSRSHAAFHARAAFGRASPAYSIFDLANGETLGHRFAREIRDDVRILQREERSRVADR